MIKFILHGGRTRIDCESNDDFYRAIFDIDKVEVNFLLVPFARPENEQLIPEDMVQKILQLNPSKKINFVLATEENFIEQINQADTVFIRGGDTRQLKDKLKNVPNLKSLFDGKIIAGSSAGAIFLAKYYFDQDHDAIEEGFNILPVKMITHFGLPNQYNQSYDKELEELKNYKKEENLETITLKETEFIIKEVG